jgi:hypothetical protein
LTRPLKSRALLLALLCIILPIPLVGLVLMASHPPRTPRPQAETRLIPMLPLDARRALPTYARNCNTVADCDPPLGCLFIQSELRAECTDSMCMKDEDCPEEFSCVSVKTQNGKALVRRCALVGHRKEGENCEMLALTHHLGCERGLQCQEGWCGRPCQLDDPSSCPTGFFCAEGREGPPSCLPTCKGRSCPEGQRCLRAAGGASVCRQLDGPDCTMNPCPEGHKCKLLSPPQRPWEMRTECRQGCDFETPCPEGLVCYRFECRKVCDPQGSSICGPGQRCGQRSPMDPGYYCLPG